MPSTAKIRAEQDGAVAILVALLMVVMLSTAALVIDLGGLYSHDRELQTAADAGALAGALELIYTDGSQPAAGSKAVEFVNKNTSPNSNVEAGNLAPWSPLVTDRSVTVELEEEGVPFFFAPILGQTEGSVRARAKAEVKYLTGVQKLFPVAVLYMNPERFRFVVEGVGHFDITDEDGNGVYDGGGATFPASVAPGTYSIDLQAITRRDGTETVALELPDIGVWRVSNPADPDEKLYEAGMSKSGNWITVRAVTATTVTTDTLRGELGKNRFFTLSYSHTNGDGTRVYSGGISAPTGTDANSGYGVHDLLIEFPNQPDSDDGPGGGNSGGGRTEVLAGRYLAFHQDVPLLEHMMTPGFYSGYSRRAGSAQLQSAYIVTRQLQIGDTYTLKLSNQGGSGLYAGNWRLADIWRNVNTMEEIATVEPPEGWELQIDPLVIGGELMPETGASVGQVINGLDQRLSPLGNNTPMDDPRRVVIIPIVDYAPDLSGVSQNYVIDSFAAFRITHYSNRGGDKGDIEGEFIRWAASGSWQDSPPGPLYVETAVLTE
ncbi:MAG: hypothetical protein Kow00129_12680 [Thermoleophilia bacterium]